MKDPIEVLARYVQAVQAVDEWHQTKYAVLSNARREELRLSRQAVLRVLLGSEPNKRECAELDRGTLGGEVVEP